MSVECIINISCIAEQIELIWEGKQKQAQLKFIKKKAEKRQKWKNEEKR